jgi:hypothetical protein
MAVHGAHVLLRLFHGGVGEQAAIDARRRCVVRQPLQSVAYHRIEIRKEQQRNFRRPPNLRRDLEHPRQCGTRLEGALAGRLNHRAIGDGVGEWHPQFNEVRAAADQRFHQRGRAVGRGIAHRQIGDEALTIGLF